MFKYKKIVEVLSARATLEGAGVHLHRGFGQPQIPKFDPFLLFDDFSAQEPADYLAGFPWHPHRGIETVTYVLKGKVNHKDSIGNSGQIAVGDVQWMSAGSGILHEEMPQGTSGMVGFQLWVNLPKNKKMSKPNYQDIKKKDISEVSLGSYATVRTIAGNFGDINGPVKDIAAAPMYLDIELVNGKDVIIPIPSTYNSFVYIIDGNLGLGFDEEIVYQKGNILHFDKSDGDIFLKAGSTGARFLLASGKPLNETIAWKGPIVMNTEEELNRAWQDLEDNTFIKNK